MNYEYENRIKKYLSILNLSEINVRIYCKRCKHVSIFNYDEADVLRSATLFCLNPICVSEKKYILTDDDWWDDEEEYDYEYLW